MKKEKIFLGFGNVFASLPENISEQKKQHIHDIFCLIGKGLAQLDCIYIFAGRKKSLAKLSLDKMLEEHGSEWIKKHILTYLPNNFEDLTDKDSFVQIGKSLRKGNWIEERRNKILDDADIILLTGGSRGVNSYIDLLKKKNKFVIPLPIGKGAIDDLYQKFLSRHEHTEMYHDILTIGDQTGTSEEISNAYLNIVKSVLDKKVNRSQAFLAMPFVDSFPERIDAEDVLDRVCKKLNIDLYIAQDLDGQSSIIAEILDGINKSNFLIAYLDENRPNVYFEAGYAKGANKPVIFCRHSSRSAAFDTNNFENIVWDSFKDLEKKLIDKIKILKNKSLIP